MVSSSGIDIGPLSISKESSTETTGPYITHDASGATTGTVQVDFNLKSGTAGLFIGVAKESATVVRSFTPTVGPVETTTIGTTTNKSTTFNIPLPNGLNVGAKIPITSNQR
jgi:hypothetical protein